MANRACAGFRGTADLWADRSGHLEPVVASMAHALQHEAFADGKVLLLGDAGDSSYTVNVNSLIICYTAGVDGLIYTGVGDRHPYINLIRRAVPCVMLDRCGSQA